MKLPTAFFKGINLEFVKDIIPHKNSPERLHHKMWSQGVLPHNRSEQIISSDGTIKVKVWKAGVLVEQKVYDSATRVLHNLSGPALETIDGIKAWYVNGILHRVDGPAVIRANGDQEWYYNGKAHRLDGPASITADGKESFWIEGTEIKPKAFNSKVKKYLRKN